MENNNTFGKNLKKYRKGMNLSQQQLAEMLFISVQSVSKWETGNGYPSYELLDKLSKIFEVSLDVLMNRQNQIPTKYHDLYKRKEYFWGTLPNEMDYKLLQIAPPHTHNNVLELGCAEGCDAVFFAKNGYTVTALDVTTEGLDKGRMLARLSQTFVNFVQADITEFKTNEVFDLVYGYKVMHYVSHETSRKVINNYKKMTREGGIHALTVILDKPFIPTAPDNDETGKTYKSGEIMMLYCDWEILYCDEKIVDCNSSGIPHKHAMNYIIAKKPSSSSCD